MPETDSSNARALAFERWANVYTAHKAFSHPSELHGGLCGRLAAGGRLDDSEWLAVVCEHMGLPEAAPEESEELRNFMAAAYEEVLEKLKAADMSFHPLLPDDDYAIDQRLEALSSWIRGFLEGMAVSAGESLGEAPDEIRDLIEDMVAISQVSEAGDEGEESEQQLLEIVEYIRLGALAVFTEFNPPEPPPAAQSPTLH